MPPPPALRFRSPVILALVLAFPASGAVAAPLSAQLTFGSLPSAQGWTYATSGVHAGTPEASVFSILGGALTMNTIGLTNVGTPNVSGILYTHFPGAITSTEAKELVVRARCTGVEPSFLPSGAFTFGFTTDAGLKYALALSDTRVMVLTPTGYLVLPGTYDNIPFHDYRLLWSPVGGGTSAIYRDGIFVGSSNGGLPFGGNHVFFGDDTGSSNARGQISSLRFTQDNTVATPSGSWGRLKSLYR